MSHAPQRSSTRLYDRRDLHGRLRPQCRSIQVWQVDAKFKLMIRNTRISQSLAPCHRDRLMSCRSSRHAATPPTFQG